MVDTRAFAQVIIFNELMDSDDEKHHRGKTRWWVKRRSDRGYFNNIIKESRVEDRTGFRDMKGITYFHCVNFIIAATCHVVSSVFFVLPCL